MRWWQRPEQQPAAPTHVPAADVDEWLGGELTPRLERLNFRQVNRRRWVRSDSAPIRHVVEVHALKSGALTPYWFLSLDFAQHLNSAGQLKRHATDRSVHPDLRYDPLDYHEGAWQTGPGATMADFAASNRARADWAVSRYGPPQEVRASVRSLAAWTVPRADVWLKRVTRPEDLPSAFQAAADARVTRFGMDNYVQQRVAWAFSLAYLGDPVGAGEQLDIWFSKRGALSDDERISLRQRIEAALP